MVDGTGVNKKSSPLARRLFTGGVHALVIKAIGLSSGLIVSVLLARLLSTDAMGTYFLSVSIAGLGALLARLGMSQTLVRFIAESVAVGAGGRARQTVMLVGIITLIGSLFINFILYSDVGKWLVADLFNAPLLGNLLGLLATLVSALACQKVISESFRGLHKILHASLFDAVLGTVIFSLMLFTFWISSVNLNLPDVLSLFIFATLLTIVAGVVLLFGQLRKLPGGGRVDINEILLNSYPMLVNNLGTYFFANAGLWIVGTCNSVTDVAVYGAVVRLVVLISLPLAIVNMVVQPVIAEHNMLNRSDVLERVLRASATIAGLPSAMILVVFIFASGEIMALIFGEPYRVGGVLLTIFCVGHIVNVWTGSCGNVLIYTGHPRMMMGITLASGSLSIVVALLLVKSIGAVGVALAMSIGMALHNLTLWWLVHRKVRIWTHASLDIVGLVTIFGEMIRTIRQQQDVSNR